MRRTLFQSAGPPCGVGNASDSNGGCTVCSPGTYAVGPNITFVNGVDTSCSAFANPGIIFNSTVRRFSWPVSSVLQL